MQQGDKESPPPKLANQLRNPSQTCAKRRGPTTVHLFIDTLRPGWANPNVLRQSASLSHRVAKLRLKF